MKFQKLTAERIKDISAFFVQQTTSMGVYSSAYQLMWHEELGRPDYAVVGNCLLLHGFFGKKAWFFYPISKGGVLAEEEEALCAVEAYCREHAFALRFANVPEERLSFLCARYGGCTISTDRTWDEYLYRAEDFSAFEGKKFAGQRNHVRKFQKIAPSAEFKIFRPGEEERLCRFLDRYEKESFRKESAGAKRELALTKELVGRITELGLCCGYMEENGEILSLAIGEICGDTLVEHVEKGLKSYDGIYPATAQAFVRTFAKEGVRYLNREDDAGDLGLRKSKLQYNPCRLVKKYFIEVEKPLFRVKRRPILHGERVVLKKIPPSAKEEYRVLASDVERNEYWGYDYRENLGEKEADADYFLSLIERDFRSGNELSLGIFLQGRLIGECVLHNFGYRGEAEVGVRLIAEAEGQGYAAESVRLITDYAFRSLGIERIEAKCFKQNTRSEKMLRSCGMKREGEDERFYFFSRTPRM